MFKEIYILRGHYHNTRIGMNNSLPLVVNLVQTCFSSMDGHWITLLHKLLFRSTLGNISPCWLCGVSGCMGSYYENEYGLFGGLTEPNSLCVCVARGTGWRHLWDQVAVFCHISLVFSGQVQMWPHVWGWWRRFSGRNLLWSPESEGRQVGVVAAPEFRRLLLLAGSPTFQGLSCKC